jgi:hypothetical protein
MPSPKAIQRLRAGLKKQDLPPRALMRLAGRAQNTPELWTGFPAPAFFDRLQSGRD